MQIQNAIQTYAPFNTADIAHALAMLPEGADVDEAVVGNAFLNTPYTSFILDWQGRILVCNRRARRSFGPLTNSSESDLTGMDFAALTEGAPDTVLKQLHVGAAAGTVELQMKGAANGPNQPVSVFRVSLLKSATRGERLMLLTQDQLKSNAEKLKKINGLRAGLEVKLAAARDANSHLQETLISMESFAHAAAHDLRTPISTLIGSLQFFSDKYHENLPPEALEFLQVMSRAAGQMEEMTSELLEHSVSTARSLRIESISLQEAIHEVCIDLSARIREAGAEITTPTSDVTIRADQSLLRMVLNNVLSNALKYKSPERPLQVHFSIGSTGANWHLDITDNGRGFDQAEADKIFLPFHRAHDDVPGTGVGLSTCAEICRRHNWLFTASAVPNVGARFSISFEHNG